MSEPNSSDKKTSRRFTALEDQKLQELVGQFGAKRWRRIAQYMPGRAARQCRDRYCNYLSPDFYNNKWTTEEDLLLYEKFQEFGTQWAKITQFFPGKNANNIKNRWNYSVSRLNFEGQTPKFSSSISKMSNSNLPITTSATSIIPPNVPAYGLAQPPCSSLQIHINCPNTSSTLNSGISISSNISQLQQFQPIQMNPQQPIIGIKMAQPCSQPIPQNINQISIPNGIVVSSHPQRQQSHPVPNLRPSQNITVPLIPENVCSLSQSSYSKKNNITTNVYDVVPRKLPSIQTLIAEIKGE